MPEISPAIIKATDTAAKTATTTAAKTATTTAAKTSIFSKGLNWVKANPKYSALGAAGILGTGYLMSSKDSKAQALAAQQQAQGATTQDPSSQFSPPEGFTPYLYG